jgi:hypothetical protein
MTTKPQTEGYGEAFGVDPARVGQHGLVMLTLLEIVEDAYWRLDDAIGSIEDDADYWEYIESESASNLRALAEKAREVLDALASIDY